MYLEHTGMENCVSMIQTDCTSAGVHYYLLQAVLVEKCFEHITSCEDFHVTIFF